MTVPPPPARSSTRPRILVVGDAVASTGFARVLHSVLLELAADHEIHQIGINYHGDPHAYPWKIYPAKLGGDLQGVGRLRPMIDQIEPDLVFMLNDIWVLAQYCAALGELVDRRRFGLVAYCPIDAGPVDPEHIEKVAGFDRFVTYTEFGRRVIEAGVDRARTRDRELAFPRVEVIAHGVDLDRFPAHAADVGQLDSPARQAAIIRLFGDDPELRDPFIVLNANRNQPRKRIDLTIEGFARFAEGKPNNVRLYLHMGIEDAGWNVVKLCRRYGIEDRLILTADTNSIPSVPDTQLRDIYLASVVGINTSIAEGWGLVAFEHAATGAAQIVPRHSACAELWDGAATLLEPRTTLITPQILTEGHLVDPGDVAAALEQLHADRELLAQMCRAAHARVSHEEYRWSVIASRWRDLFSQTMVARRAQS